VTPRANAPFDPTGYWVSIVTEDWRYRMVTPPKGNYLGIPLTPEGRRTADQWDPAKDEAAGQQCRSFGAAGIMRMPGRFHITWQDDSTLKIEADNSSQTRVFHFGGKAEAGLAPSWQGYSTADWELAPAAGRGAPRQGDLKVTTTAMLPGYVRRNGVPYSGEAVLTEWYDRIKASNGDDWLVVTTEVNDPRNFNMPFTNTTHFKLEADGKGWNPQPCTAR
jgi:hypothetical protein